MVEIKQEEHLEEYFKLV